MQQQVATFKNSKTAKLVFLLSILVSVFWCLVQVLNDVYRFAVVGALFEILWLPMIGGLFILPIISIIQLVKEKLDRRSLYLYSILIIAVAVLAMTFLV